MRFLGWLLSGLLFGVGLSLSGMMNPMKVRNFLDVSDLAMWDPSLVFVMGGALLTAFVGYRLVWRRGAPLADSRFHLPPKTPVFDRDLINGAVIFGAGWGLAGLCPGPALASLAFLTPDGLIFAAAMLAGMAAARAWKARRA